MEIDHIFIMSDVSADAERYSGAPVPVKYESRAGAVLYAKDVDRLASFYSTVLGLSEANRDHDHVVLESPGFQLVILQIPREIAATIEIAVPPARRARAAVKLVFFIPSLDDVRASVEVCGGVMNPIDLRILLIFWSPVSSVS